jgi:hypothetical protein
MQSSTVTRAMGRLAPAKKRMKIMPFPNDLTIKAQDEIALANFPWPCRKPLLGNAWEPPGDPYYHTFGLVVTASVHPQLSGTRSSIPDNAIRHPLSGGRTPSGSRYRGFK